MEFTSKIVYSGNLRTEATHLQSGKSIITDAPTDNNGKGEAFSPTDLLSTSLASCMLTIMGITAEKHDINFSEAECNVKKHMTSNPRKVSQIDIEISVKGAFSDKEKLILERAALSCPVALSLHPDIKQNVEIKFTL